MYLKKGELKTIIKAAKEAADNDWKLLVKSAQRKKIPLDIGRALRLLRRKGLPRAKKKEIAALLKKMKGRISPWWLLPAAAGGLGLGTLIGQTKKSAEDEAAECIELLKEAAKKVKKTKQVAKKVRKAIKKKPQLARMLASLLLPGLGGLGVGYLTARELGRKPKKGEEDLEELLKEAKAKPKKKQIKFLTKAINWLKKNKTKLIALGGGGAVGTLLARLKTKREQLAKKKNR